MSRYEKGDIKLEGFDIYQYYGTAKNMPKRMREHFKDKGIEFDPNEWVNVNEYVKYSLENRWL